MRRNDEWTVKDVRGEKGVREKAESAKKILLPGVTGVARTAAKSTKKTPKNRQKFILKKSILTAQVARARRSVKRRKIREKIRKKKEKHGGIGGEMGQK